MSLATLKTRLEDTRAKHAQMVAEFAAKAAISVQPELDSIRKSLAAIRSARALNTEDAEFITVADKRIVELEELEKVAAEIVKLQNEIDQMERTGKPIEQRSPGATVPTSSL